MDISSTNIPSKEMQKMGLNTDVNEKDSIHNTNDDELFSALAKI